MALMGIDTRWWNLAGVAVTATAAGCGPSIVLSDDGATDADDGVDDGVDDGIDDGVDDGINDGPTVPPPPPTECQIDSDCQPGYSCNDAGICEYDGYYCGDYGGYGGDCCDGGCCDGGCYYGECYGDADCDDDEFCDFSYGYGGGGYCETVPAIQDCDASESPELLLLPSPEGADPVTSLAFVELNGDAAADLVVGRTTGAAVHLGVAGEPGTGGPGVGVPLPLPEGTTLRAAAGGDLSGDGFADLVTADTEGTMLLLLGDGTGALTLASPDPIDAPAASELAILDFNGDELPDLAQRGPEGISVLLGDGAGSFTASVALQFSDATAMTVSAPAAGTASILTSGEGILGEFFGGTEDADGSLDAIYAEDPTARWLPLSAGSGNARTIAAANPIANGTSLSVFWDTGLERYALTHRPNLAATGDLGGDGEQDFVLSAGSEGGAATYIKTHPSGGLDCAAALDLGAVAPEAMVVGDADGNGSADIVVAEGAVVSVFVTN